MKKTIKECKELYEELRECRMLRLRRSSRHSKIEETYMLIYNIEEHILYRKSEISSIYSMYMYYKNIEETLYWLRKRCKIYVLESSFEMLGIYLVGENTVEKKVDSKEIMECRLNLKDKNLTKGEIYTYHCMELENIMDRFGYNILAHM
tara:strand:- start:367 stop:813 length:447 start_codon:yes stop_codon:yes gene_type:complete